MDVLPRFSFPLPKLGVVVFFLTGNFGKISSLGLMSSFEEGLPLKHEFLILTKSGPRDSVHDEIMFVCLEQKLGLHV